jgi:hypothetical protein
VVSIIENKANYARRDCFTQKNNLPVDPSSCSELSAQENRDCASKGHLNFSTVARASLGIAQAGEPM